MQQQVDPAGAIDADWLFALDLSNDPWIDQNASVREMDGSTSGTFWGCVAGRVCPYSAEFCNQFVLDPIPDLEFFPDAHRYMWRSDWVLHNVSEVVSHDMSPFAKDAMEKHKHGPDGWELRGRVLHRVLQAHLENQPSVHEDRWDPWIEPLLSDPLFKGIETVATEYLLVDRYRSVCRLL